MEMRAGKIFQIIFHGYIPSARKLNNSVYLKVNKKKLPSNSQNKIKNKNKNVINSSYDSDRKKLHNGQMKWVLPGKELNPIFILSMR